MATNAVRRMLPLWVLALLLGAAVALAAIATLGSTAQAQQQATNGLSIKKTIQPKTVKVGKTQVYTINIRNTTNSRLTGVVMTDTLPRNVKFIRASTSLQIPGSCRPSGRTVVCGPYALAAGELVTIRIYVKTTKVGTYRNVASVVHNAAEGELGAVPPISNAATHRAVKRDGGGKQRCGVRAEAKKNGAKACVGGVKAKARR
jgi:uncharacterized repeat protein (TIGR01451 family)